MRKALALLSLVGCTGARDPPATGSVSRTVVVLHGDAPPTITMTEISRAEHLAEVAARDQCTSTSANQVGVRREAILQDGSCRGASLWIFDNYGNVAGTFPNNHEICFYADQPVWTCTDLASYLRYCSHGLFTTCYYWGAPYGYAVGPYVSAIRSLWAGSDEGYFPATPKDGGLVGAEFDFDPWSRFDNTDGIDAVHTAGQICLQPQLN
jgi:hypothetical protein